MFKKLKPLPGKPNPCLCCPPIPGKACLSKIIAVGFGCAVVLCDGKVVADGESPKRKRFLTFKDAERMAAKKPHCDWRVRLDGPMHGETYQRQDKELWLLVEKNEGFA